LDDSFRGKWERPNCRVCPENQTVTANEDGSFDWRELGFVVDKHKRLRRTSRAQRNDAGRSIDQAGDRRWHDASCRKSKSSIHDFMDSQLLLRWAGMMTAWTRDEKERRRLKNWFSDGGFPFNTRNFHFTGVKPQKMFPSVSPMNVRVFAWPSQRP
jgi:hypothetical protein